VGRTEEKLIHQSWRTRFDAVVAERDQAMRDAVKLWDDLDLVPRQGPMALRIERYRRMLMEVSRLDRPGTSEG